MEFISTRRFFRTPRDNDARAGSVKKTTGKKEGKKSRREQRSTTGEREEREFFAARSNAFEIIAGSPCTSRI